MTDVGVGSSALFGFWCIANLMTAITSAASISAITRALFLEMHSARGKTSRTVGRQGCNVVAQPLEPIIPKNAAANGIETEELAVGVREDPIFFRQYGHEAFTACEATFELSLPQSGAGILVDGDNVCLHSNVDYVLRHDFFAERQR